MKQTGYYEIVHHMESLTGLKMRAIAGNVQFNRLHWHDSLEIMCCVHGSFSMRFPDGCVTLHEGDLITVDSGLAHEIYDGTDDGLQLIFSVDASLLRLKETERYDFSTVATSGSSSLSKDHPDVKGVRSAIAQLICLIHPENDEQWYTLHQELYRILAILSRHIVESPSHTRSSGQRNRYLQCLEIVHNHYEKPLSAATLASEIGFSEPTIYRLFQMYTGLSFTEYLNSIRISAACGQLESVSMAKNGLSMTELATQCGFVSLSNFYRAFHQFTGMSPREYRKLHQADHRLPSYQEYLSPRELSISQHDLMQMNRFQPLHLLPANYMKDIRFLAGL